MTIPADHWHTNPDGTAWWVPAPIAGEPVLRELDRLCDTCGGTEVTETEHGIIDPSDGSVTSVETVIHACPDCINGRHTFTVEVENSYPGWLYEKSRPLRVSVVKVEPQDDGTWRVLLRIHHS